MTGKVVYTPPEGEEVIRQKLKNLEDFIHADDTIDPLVKMAIIHYQFEAIHPLEADYNTMLTEMIYDEAPTFQKLIDEISQLKTEINNLNWKMKTEFPLPKS